MSLPKMKISF